MKEFVVDGGVDVGEAKVAGEKEEEEECNCEKGRGGPEGC